MRDTVTSSAGRANTPQFLLRIRGGLLSQPFVSPTRDGFKATMPVHAFTALKILVSVPISGRDSAAFWLRQSSFTGKGSKLPKNARHSSNLKGSRNRSKNCKTYPNVISFVYGYDWKSCIIEPMAMSCPQIWNKGCWGTQQSTRRRWGQGRPKLEMKTHNTSLQNSSKQKKRKPFWPSAATEAKAAVQRDLTNQ